MRPVVLKCCACFLSIYIGFDLGVFILGDKNKATLKTIEYLTSKQQLLVRIVGVDKKTVKHEIFINIKSLNDALNRLPVFDMTHAYLEKLKFYL